MTFITKLLKDLRYDHKTMKLQQTVAEDLLSTFEFAGSPENKRAAADILEKLFHRKGITTATKKNIAEHYILLRCWGRGYRTLYLTASDLKGKIAGHWQKGRRTGW